MYFSDMAEKKTGRKKAFEPEEKPIRLSIILPQETKIALDVLTAKSELNRNEIINNALIKYIEKESKKLRGKPRSIV